jgi:hypothetical protein
MASEGQPVAGGRARTAAEAGLADVAWTHRLGPYAGFGQCFRIHTTDGALAGLLADLYGAMAVPEADVADPGGVVDYRILPPADGRHGALLRGDEMLGRHPKHAIVLGRLVWAINQQVIKGSPDRLLLHASAADLDGVGVLVPAEMESGKTTFVTGLLDRGLGYLTDEAASVTTDLVMEGYPKPLSIDPGAWDVVPHHRPQVGEELEPYFAMQWHVPAQRIGPVVHRTRLGMIVFRRYEPDTPLRFERLTAVDAIEPAVASTFVTDRPFLSAARLRELAAVVEQVPAYELVGGELDEACAVVIEELRRVAADA